MATPTDGDSARLPDGVQRLTATVVSLGKVAAVVLFCLAWAAFWGNVARLHYVGGDPGRAAVVLATMVAPVLAGMAWYVVSTVEAIGPSSPLAALQRATSQAE